MAVSRMLAVAGLLVLAVARDGAGRDGCVPKVGEKRPATVSFAPPQDGLVAGLNLIVDYPEGKVSLPGSGTAVPKEALAGAPPGAVIGANDYETEVRIVAAVPGELPPGKLVELRFDACEGATAAVGDDFTCRVVEAADPATNLVNGVTCRVTVP